MRPLLILNALFLLAQAHAQAQSEVCVVEMRLYAQLDTTSTYTIGQYHVQGAGPRGSMELFDCVDLTYQQFVVLDRTFVHALCACRTQELRLGSIAVLPMDRGGPQDRLTMMLGYVERVR